MSDHAKSIIALQEAVLDVIANQRDIVKALSELAARVRLLEENSMPNPFDAFISQSGPSEFWGVEGDGDTNE